MAKDEIHQILMDLKRGQEELSKGQNELFGGQKQLIEEQKEIKSELRKLSETVAKIEVEHGQKLEILLDVVTGQIKKFDSEEQRIEKCEKRLDKHDDQFYYLNSKVQAY